VGHLVTQNFGTKILEDLFGRTVADGLGSPDLGPAYTIRLGPATDYDVGGGVATVVLNAAGATRAWNIGTDGSRHGEAEIRFKTDKVAAGGAYLFYVRPRFVDANNYYEVRVEMRTSQQIHVTVYSVVGGVATSISDSVFTTTVHAANTFLRVKVQWSGVNPTALLAKVWTDGQAEPSTWQVGASDSTAALQSASTLEYGAELKAGVGNAPVLLTLDDFRLRPAASPYFKISFTNEWTPLKIAVKNITDLVTSAGLYTVIIGARSNAAGDGTSTPWITTFTPLIDATAVTPALGGEWANQSYYAVSFSSDANWRPRLRGSALLGSGSYRMFARGRKSVNGDMVQMRAKTVVSEGSVGEAMGPIVEVPAGLGGGVVGLFDLGDVNVPESAVTGTGVLAQRRVSVDLLARRASGAGSLYIDALIFVPQDLFLIRANIRRLLGSEYRGDEGVVGAGTATLDPVAHTATLRAGPDEVRYPTASGLPASAGGDLDTNAAVHWFEFGLDIADSFGSVYLTVTRSAGPIEVAKILTAGKHPAERLAWAPSSGLSYYAMATILTPVQATILAVRHMLAYQVKGQERMVLDNTQALPVASHEDANGARLRDLETAGSWPFGVSGEVEFVTLVTRARAWGGAGGDNVEQHERDLAVDLEVLVPAG
jgi:hypothetical protein